MLRTFLFSILCGLVSAAFFAVSSRFREPRRKEHSEFRFSTSSRAFIWIFTSAGLVGLAAAMSADGCLPVTASSLLFAGCMAIFGYAVCVWTDRFVLKFFDDHLIYGAFRTDRIDYKDIVSAQRRRAGTGSAVVESFNGRLRRECLNEHWFLSLADARSKIGEWRMFYD